MGTEGRVGRIIRTFLAGVLALLPIAVTVIGAVAFAALFSEKRFQADSARIEQESTPQPV